MPLTALREVQYSPLLLAQIPPTRSDTGSKWDANDPLEIVFHCFKQHDESRRAMGSRLLNLVCARNFHSTRTLNRIQLINLTSTNLFDLPLFMNLLIPRLPSGVSDMRELLSGMSSTPTLCKFKVALCQRYLTRASVGAYPSSFRGRPRAQPRPITGRKHANKKNPTLLMTSDSKQEIAPTLNQNQHALPPASELLHLLAMKINADTLSNTIKYDLLVTYGILQHQAPDENKSRDWMEMLQNGRVEAAVKEAFGSSKDQSSGISQRILLGMIATWR
jgi:hypothetical protein